eukprot:TRINITY_DN50755_c0_g1_i1.p1 TRINITY_DN50755_c0_g1~~TRINITY_DN50755_c0_g1_i1.p1  ORF type:complete len:269 (-),score=35.84 TRINITY_DN50755_c0_g1_i1:67-873(-)
MTRQDHDVLLKFARSLTEHVLGGETLLAPVYMHFSLRSSTSSSRNFVAMRNVHAYGGPWTARYDLKGSAHDKTIELDGRPVRAVHKRIWRLYMWCSTCFWSLDRWKYYQGKLRARALRIDLPCEFRAKILRCIDRDCKWLAAHNLMDYSLLIGVIHSPADAPADEPALCNNNRSVSTTTASWPSEDGDHSSGTFSWKMGDSDGNHDAWSMTIGIIDIFQRWNLKKRLACIVKVFSFNKSTIPPKQYAKRFSSHFARVFRDFKCASATL